MCALILKSSDEAVAFWNCFEYHDWKSMLTENIISSNF